MRMRKKDFIKAEKNRQCQENPKRQTYFHVRLLAVLRWDKKEQRLVEKCTQFKYEQIKKALHKECKSFND